MAKKLIDLEKKVDSSVNSFTRYLEENTNREVFNFIEKLSEKSSTYVFSGVIRNFFLNNPIVRDIDLVVEDYNAISSILSPYNVRQNSFGGLKVNFDDTHLDIWQLDQTWAFNYQKSFEFNFELEKYIPQTAFFNFSAIVYSFDENKFYYRRDFLRFIRDKKIELLYVPNANHLLCVINTFYYADTYHLGIGDKLKRFILKFGKAENVDYETIQLKHFKTVKYTNAEIKKRIRKLVLPYLTI